MDREAWCAAVHGVEWGPKSWALLSDWTERSWWCCGKESSCQCRRCKRFEFQRWIGKIPRVRSRNPLQYSCLENLMDRRARWATVYGVAKSWTWLNTHTHTHTHTHHTTHHTNSYSCLSERRKNTDRYKFRILHFLAVVHGQALERSKHLLSFLIY